MLAFAMVLVLGTAIGLARGGGPDNVTGEHLALLPLVWAAAGLQIAAQLVPEEASIAAYAMVIVSYATLFAFAGANFRVPGMAFIALGAALNYIVILANQGMPVSAEAAARAGIASGAESLVLRGKHVLVSGGDATFPLLGDIIPLWRQPAVASVGDLIIWAGLILLIQDLMQPRARRAKRRGRAFLRTQPTSDIPVSSRDIIPRQEQVDVRDIRIDITDERAREQPGR